MGVYTEFMGKSIKTALVMSGGGARSAYQVGVLKGLAEILPAEMENPFQIICGTSAGAINAVSLAAQTGSFQQAVAGLSDVWGALTVDQVYRCECFDLLKGLGRLGLSLFNEGVGRKQPLALLDNSPLREMLERNINLDNIQTAISAGAISAVSVTAMSYSSGESVSFFQAPTEVQGWRRHRRSGAPDIITLDHLLASSAIPLLFPAVPICREYFGDGAVRQDAPISPALHLGADKVFVIGVSSNRNPQHWGKKHRPTKHSPSMGQITGHMFNSAFVDGLEGDIEHLERVNELLRRVPEDQHEIGGHKLRPVDTMIVSPSAQLDVIAGRKIRYLPRALRLALRAVGATAKGGGATAASYLLFAQPFIQELIDLGYQDTMWERERVEKFFEL